MNEKKNKGGVKGAVIAAAAVVAGRGDAREEAGPGRGNS